MDWPGRRRENPAFFDKTREMRLIGHQFVIQNVLSSLLVGASTIVTNLQR